MRSNINSRKGDGIMTENELFILTAIYKKWPDETFKKCSVDFQTQKHILQSLEKKGYIKNGIYIFPASWEITAAGRKALLLCKSDRN